MQLTPGPNPRSSTERQAGALLLPARERRRALHDMAQARGAPRVSPAPGGVSLLTLRMNTREH